MSIERSIIQKLRESREVEDEELLDEEFEDEVEDEEVVEEEEDIVADEEEVVEECDTKKPQRTPLEESIIRRLTEAWAPSLNSLRRPEKEIVRKELTKAGIDIENTPYKEVYITNGKDPRLKGMNVVIFELYRGGVAVWFNNKFIVDSYIYPEGKNLSRLSWKTILSYATRIISIEFDEQAAQRLKDKQAKRKESQSGMLQRFTPQNKPRYAKIDKSGYIVDPRKYRDMLAKMKLKDAPKVLEQAKAMYVKLAGNIDKVDWENDRDYYNYDTVMKGIVNEFQSLTRALGEYERYKQRKKDEGLEKWWSEHLESQVTGAIMNLRDWLNKGKKYL